VREALRELCDELERDHLRASLWPDIGAELGLLRILGSR
jgi:hypothetical protein